MMDILVFKTDVANIENAAKIGSILNAVQGIGNWNFGLEDCDNILRIESDGIVPDRITVKNSGFRL